MDKQAVNTFVGGLVTDRHPLTAQNTELVDARNTDLIQVGEGYQLILQKREGNTELMYDDGLGGGPVSAGLDPGYIPLAVKEFNNVAYIISVNPTTSKGQLGTFPSPDYDGFEYQEGAVIPGGASVGTIIYDASADLPDYNYSFVEVADAGDDEEVDGGAPANFDLRKAGFTLTNTGANLEYFELTLDAGAGITISVDDVTYTTPIVIYPGQATVVKLLLTDPFAETVGVVYTRTITVTPQDNPTPVVSTQTFSRHTIPAIKLKDDVTNTYIAGGPTNTWIPAAADTVTYLYLSNVTITSQSIAIAGAPAWLVASSLWPALSFELQAGLNTDGIARTAGAILTANHAGGSILYSINFGQYDV